MAPAPKFKNKLSLFFYIDFDNTVKSLKRWELYKTIDGWAVRPPRPRANTRSLFRFLTIFNIVKAIDF